MGIHARIKWVTCPNLKTQKKKREGLCDRVEIVKKHCPKTCNSCPIFSPTEIPSIVPSKLPSIFPSATHACTNKIGYMSIFTDQGRTYKKKKRIAIGFSITKIERDCVIELK